jgi:hypothetical protein
MKKSMHINESIPVTITHVKENRKSAGKKRVMCGHAGKLCYLMHLGTERMGVKLANFVTC